MGRRPRQAGAGGTSGSTAYLCPIDRRLIVTSWTFFGSVGLSAKSGYDFIPVYLGPLLMFLFGTPLILRIVRLSKSQNITSIADFLAARYG